MPTTSTTSAESSDFRWMERCAELARRAASAGNTPVGSVVVLKGEAVAEASEEVPRGPRPFAHAEILAVEEALRRFGREGLRQATLYSTAEPCLLCAYAIREARIGRLVLGRASGEVGGAAGRFPLLTTSEIERWGPPPEVIWWPSERWRSR